MERKMIASICMCVAVMLASSGVAVGQAVSCLVTNPCGNQECKYWPPGGNDDIFCLMKSEEACIARGVCDKNINVCFNIKKENGITVREPVFSTSCTEYNLCSTLQNCQKCTQAVGSGTTGCTADALTKCQQNSTECGPCKGLCGSAGHLRVTLVVQLLVLALALLSLW